ncbi:Membrane protein involved in the export of O-antigen and teichoic acid [Candidatus Kryptonium thompsonii]|uniref:oligosaccharide flippase family protein n=1 Tax=Candidatus Kryptonium thompsonii TaxID=1633631 RepID=UPI0007081549|nr:oligosaccharide flippase family protein [Candidatus Kryptonium thompsoni]CUS80407.1 Membrane protein involved in the export of O-antigen and teichoic acid [Candidatus Kryptonium thompsoni]
MDRSENLTIVKKAGFVSLSRFINLLGLLLTTIMLARYLSKPEFASYDQLWLIYNTFSPVLSFAFTSSVYFFGTRENAGKYITAMLLFLTLAGFILTFSLFLLRFEIAKFLNNLQFYNEFFKFAPFFLFSLPSLILDAILVLKNEFKKLFTITNFTVLAYIGVVVLTIILEQGIPFIFAGLSLISLLRFVYTWYLIKKFFNEKLETIFPYLKEILLYTSPLIVGHISALISRQVDKYIIANNFSSDLYATYTIGAKELPIIPLITSSFASVIFPEISKLHGAGKNSEIQRLIKDVVKSTSLIIIPIFSFLLFFSQEFILILFSKKYLDSTAIFRIYLFFLPVRILVYSSILSAFGRQKIYMLISFLDLVLNLTLGTTLVKAIGLLGPAIAVVVSTYVEALAMLFFISKALGKVNLLEILPVKFMISTFAFSLFASFLCYLMGSLIENAILRFILMGGLFSTFYLLVAVKLHKQI